MEQYSDADRRYMLEALGLARLGWGLTNPNPMVGAVLVRDGEIIGRGFHLRAGEPHAEINAFNDAAAHGREISGATLYVTLEPCCTEGRTPACTAAILRHRIRRVVIGAVDPNPRHNGGGIEILEAAGIEVTVGVEGAACRRLNQAFFKWVTTGRPFVMLKLATTLDGRIATASGDSKWITGVEARQRVQRLRRLADAVMVGAETVRHDHPALTVRDPENWSRQPLRLVASRTMTAAELAEYFPDGRAEIVALDEPDDWNYFLATLGDRGMIALLIEGGGELAAAALRAGAVDYVEFHIAPRLLGGRGSRPAVGGPDPEFMDQARQLYRVEVERCGSDLIVSGYTAE